MPKGDIELPRDPEPESIADRSRRLAIELLNKHLGGQADSSKFSPAREPPVILSASREPPPLYTNARLVDDPQADLAVVLMQRRYPELFKNVESVWTGAPQNPGIGGFVRRGFGSGAAHISLGHSRGDLGDALDTLRHELGHVSGLEDTGRPNAYDVSSASNDLHRDIRLPSASGRVALPGKETKQTELEQWYVDRELEQRRRKIQNVTKK